MRAQGKTFPAAAMVCTSDTFTFTHQIVKYITAACVMSGCLVQGNSKLDSLGNHGALQTRGQCIAS